MRRTYYSNYSRFTKGMLLRGLAVGLLFGGLTAVVTAVVMAGPNQVSMVRAASNETIAVDEPIQGNAPAAVLKAAGAVVALQRSTDPAGEGLVASGVAVGSGTIVTAGHTVAQAGSLVCSNTQILKQHATIPVVQGAASFGTASGYDIAALAVARQQANLPTVQLASKSAAVGETVYFVNYQQLADGTRRDPRSHGESAHPALFRAIVVSANGNGFMAANYPTTGQNETILRLGGSGGAVLAADGSLLGLSVATESLAPDHTAGQISTQFNVRLPQGSYQLSRAQTVTSSLLTSLRAGLTACR